MAKENSQTHEQSSENKEGMLNSTVGGATLAPPTFQLKASGSPASAGDGSDSDLVSGFAQTTGHDLSDVNVHYGSSKPATMGAHAYAQGNDVHLAPGQEQHLPHEMAHVVQQRESRVKANTEVNGQAVNDEKSLESEADVMGAKASGASGTTQLKADGNVQSGAPGASGLDVIQKQDVNGRIWMTREDDDGDTDREMIMMRWTVPSWNVATWQANMGNLDDTQQIMGFLVFGAWPHLAGCDHDTMWQHVAPFASQAGNRLGRDNDFDPATESEARGFGEHLGAAIFGGDISTANIENYYNNASAPTETQIEDFFIALMTHGGDVGLQDQGFGDIETWLAGMTDSFSTNLAKSAFRILSGTYVARALSRIASDGALRSVEMTGTQAMAEYTSDAGRGTMFAQAMASASKGLDLVSAGSETRTTGNSGNTDKNTGFNLITQSGSTMLAVLRAQTSVDADAQAVFDTVFDQVWGVIPGGGFIVGAAKTLLKNTIKSGIHSMIAGDDYEDKIDSFRATFNRAATNLADTGGSLSPEEARISVNALFSSSG